MGRQLLTWDAWHPGLDTDDMTIRDVLDTMPAAEQEDVPAIIQQYENPGSPDALPGAVSLARHDCIHVLLGRGLHVQDEAFVIGATMGADETFTQAHKDAFIRISTTLYPKHWRFTEDHLASYRLGVGFSQDNLRGRNLHLIPLEEDDWQDKTVKQARRELGIVKAELRAYLRKERLLTPHTKSSQRLDGCAHTEDRDLSPPE